MRSLIVPVIVGSLFVVTPSSALVFCKKKSGVMVARETCKPKETRLDLGAGGPQVVDSAGQVVGGLADGTKYADATHAIRVLDDGSAVWLSVTRSHLEGLDDRLYYEGDGCSGTPYICEFADDLVVGTVLPYDPNTGQQASGTLHYATGEPVRRTTPGWYRDAGDGSCEPVVSPFETSCQTATTATIPVFVPPFSVR